MNSVKVLRRQLLVLRTSNLMFLGSAILVLLVFDHSPGRWAGGLISLLIGWGITCINLEAIRWIVCYMVGTTIQKDQELGAGFYLAIVAKLSVLGMLIALLSTTSWIDGLYFICGMATLVFSSAILGMREWRYARTS